MVGMVQHHGIVRLCNIYIEGSFGNGEDLMGIVNVIAPLHVRRCHVRRSTDGLFSTPNPHPDATRKPKSKPQVSQEHTRIKR